MRGPAPLWRPRAPPPRARPAPLFFFLPRDVHEYDEGIYRLQKPSKPRASKTTRTLIVLRLAGRPFGRDCRVLAHGARRWSTPPAARRDGAAPPGRRPEFWRPQTGPGRFAGGPAAARSDPRPSSASARRSRPSCYRGAVPCLWTGPRPRRRSIERRRRRRRRARRVAGARRGRRRARGWRRGPSGDDLRRSARRSSVARGPSPRGDEPRRSRSPSARRGSAGSRCSRPRAAPRVLGSIREPARRRRRERTRNNRGRRTVEERTRVWVSPRRTRVF